MRRHSKSLAAIFLVLSTEAAVLAPFTAAEAGERCPMICCASGDGASCPMHAAPRGSAFRSCPSEPDRMIVGGRVVLALPIRAIVFIDRHPSGVFFDAAVPPELSRSERPALPPPESLA